MSDDTQFFDLGDLSLQRGGVLPDARLAYVTHGRLNAARDNVVVFPTWFAGTHKDNQWLVGPGKALDPGRWFIVMPNLFGNGLSSSPSNTPAPWSGPDFPRVTMADNVHAQYRLLQERFGVTDVKLVVGASMGGMQAFHWGALYPDRVGAIAPFVAAARCSRHNAVFLEGVRATLTLDPDFNDGRYVNPPRRGLRAMGRVYAGWAFSQAFYREREDVRSLGFASLEAFLEGFWDDAFAACDANDVLAMLWTWQHADISDNDLYAGDFDKALGAIRARAIVMPGATDLYFPPEDNAAEVAAMPNAELLPIPSTWGHFAGGPGLNAADAAFIDGQLRRLLD